MKIAIFGATGALGGECLQQALAANHDITVLVRSATKLPDALAGKTEVIEGDGLNADDVARAIPAATDAVLFAIGVDTHSPENLCTDVTRHIFEAMSQVDCTRFIWCGGGSNFMPEDQITFGAHFVRGFASLFMSLRHRDKEHQLELLAANNHVDWLGLRPLQMKQGPRRENYRLGFDKFSGFSSISFADCAHAMLGMLDDDTWLRKAPIIQY